MNAQCRPLHAVDRYPSRCLAEPAMFARQDPVVYASPSQAPPIAPDALARYAKEGFLFVPNFLQGEELSRYQRALARVRGDRRLAQREDAIREPERDALRSLFRVHEHDEDFAS